MNWTRRKRERKKDEQEGKLSKNQKERPTWKDQKEQSNWRSGINIDFFKMVRNSSTDTSGLTARYEDVAHWLLVNPDSKKRKELQHLTDVVGYKTATNDIVGANKLPWTIWMSYFTAKLKIFTKIIGYANYLPTYFCLDKLKQLILNLNVSLLN